MKSNQKTGHCVICQRVLCGRQRKYCSTNCKNADTNNRYQNYVAQQARGLKRKLLLMRERGAYCSKCGYKKNYAALGWHHREPEKKLFQVSLREMSNNSLPKLRAEIKKCDLLCANCHMETHHPQCLLPPESLA